MGYDGNANNTGVEDTTPNPDKNAGVWQTNVNPTCKNAGVQQTHKGAQQTVNTECVTGDNAETTGVRSNNALDHDANTEPSGEDNTSQARPRPSWLNQLSRRTRRRHIRRTRPTTTINTDNLVDNPVPTSNKHNNEIDESLLLRRTKCSKWMAHNPSALNWASPTLPKPLEKGYWRSWRVSRSKVTGADLRSKHIYCHH